MERCDVLVVGGGPGGSSCARALAARGLAVTVLDRRSFPRDKVCAGWVTPQVMEALGVDLDDYASKRVLQPIRGFRVRRIGDAEAVARRGGVVSYGIRRCEFDHYLLQRSGAALRLGEPLTSLERSGAAGGTRWVANGTLEARFLVGAGGHFCPVARRLAPAGSEPIVAAQELEFELAPEEAERSPVLPELPELFFTRDLRGYGWIFRKNGWLNVGLGRLGGEGGEPLAPHVEAFVRFLGEEGRLPSALPGRPRGHAYLLYDRSTRPLVAPGAVLVGDAAGLAYPRSGEGIRPAVESGLLAARAIAAARLPDATSELRAYAAALRARLGPRGAPRAPGVTDLLPQRAAGWIAGRLLSSRAFVGRVVVDRWFTRRRDPALREAQTEAG